MTKRVVVAVVIIALFASGCGDSETAESAVREPIGVGATASQGAASLIAELGSDEAAADALIIAMDRGYSSMQILDAVDEATLRSNGTIEGQEPSGPALGLVLYDLNGQGEGASGSIDGARGELQLAAFFQVEQTPIERMRANATRNLGVGEPATDQILRLLRAGFPAADVVEILILGIDGSTDHPEEPDGPTSCVRVVDEIYCPFGERFPATATADIGAAPDPDPAPDTAADTAAPEPEAPSGPVTFTGSATEGAIENDNSDDLRSADFTATVDGSNVVMQATMIVHLWHRGGYEEQYVDQNCGATYRHVLRFEGATGNPTVLRATVAASEVVEVQGVLCDDGDVERGVLTVGDTEGRFEGQANGLGIEGTISLAFRRLEISAK